MTHILGKSNDFSQFELKKAKFINLIPPILRAREFLIGCKAVNIKIAWLPISNLEIREICLFPSHTGRHVWITSLECPHELRYQ